MFSRAPILMFNKLGCFFQDDLPPGSGELPHVDWDHFFPILRSLTYRCPSMGKAKLSTLTNNPEPFSPDGQWVLGQSSEVGEVNKALKLSEYIIDEYYYSCVFRLSSFVRFISSDAQLLHRRCHALHWGGRGRWRRGGHSRLHHGG